MNFNNDLCITKILASKNLKLRVFSGYEYFKAVSKGLSAVTKWKTPVAVPFHLCFYSQLQQIRVATIYPGLRIPSNPVRVIIHSYIFYMRGVSIVSSTTQLGIYAKFMPKTESYPAILQ